MSRGKLLRHIFPSYLILVGIALIAVLWFGEKRLADTVFQRRVAGIEALARVAALQLRELTALPDDGSRPYPEVEDLCNELGSLSPVRMTVILASGRVVGDSKGNPAAMDNQAHLPEVQEAYGGATGTSIRHSTALTESVMYVAVPLDPARNLGVVRAAVPMGTINTELVMLRYLVVMAGATVLVLWVGLGLVVARRIVRPLVEMKRGAELFAAGDLESRLPVPGAEELAGLAETMNRVASQLDERLKTVVQQRNEMEAVLSSMVEGVIAIDADKRVISINRAAATMLGADAATVKGRDVFEIVRSAALLDFISETLSAEKTVESEILLQEEEKRSLQVHGSVLKDAQGRSIGALIVLNDVTPIRLLESARREFVLNASHEIRTPVTSIKGFVETLLEGALEDREKVERFLGIIAKHAERLNAIVEDMLDLSRIEREAERGEMPLAEEPVEDVVNEALEVCRPAAQSRNIEILSNYEKGVRAAMNASLVVQAVINLIDNAIKYSEPGKKVEVSCGIDVPWATIRVKDNGCGIGQNHLPRLFERFYRVDKARSRSMGGTGLGLAIVKHIVQAHHGSVIVESDLGRGSTFTVFLPLAPPAPDTAAGQLHEQ